MQWPSASKGITRMLPESFRTLGSLDIKGYHARRYRAGVKAGEYLTCYERLRVIRTIARERGSITGGACIGWSWDGSGRLFGVFLPGGLRARELLGSTSYRNNRWSIGHRVSGKRYGGTGTTSPHHVEPKVLTFRCCLPVKRGSDCVDT